MRGGAVPRPDPGGAGLMAGPGQEAAEDSRPVTYTFDMVGIATIKIRTTAGEQAARHVAAALQNISVEATPEELEYLGEIPEGTTIDVTYISPQIPAYLIGAGDSHGNPVPVSSTELAPDPLSGDARQELAGLVAAYREAADGPFGDAEHVTAEALADAVSALLEPRPLHAFPPAGGRDFPAPARASAPGRPAGVRRPSPGGSSPRTGRTA